MFHGGGAGEAGEFAEEELLEGLAGGVGSTLEGGVDFFGDAPDEYVWHACIMIANSENDKRIEVGGGNRLNMSIDIAGC